MLNLIISLLWFNKINFLFDSINNNLINIFGKKNFLSYTLVPLRKTDIEEAANYEVDGTENTSPSDFMEKVETMGAGIFASIPITLKALIHEYNHRGNLSKSKTDLYKFYCLYLCEEINEMRRDERLGLMFTPEQKYIVAARIAALCAFSGKYSIWTSPQIEGMTEVLLEIPGMNIENVEITFRNNGKNLIFIAQNEVRTYKKTIPLPFKSSESDYEIEVNNGIAIIKVYEVNK